CPRTTEHCVARRTDALVETSPSTGAPVSASAGAGGARVAGAELSRPADRAFHQIRIRVAPSPAPARAGPERGPAALARARPTPVRRLRRGTAAQRFAVRPTRAARSPRSEERRVGK